MSQLPDLKAEALARFKLRKSKPIILCVDDNKELLDNIQLVVSDHMGKNFKVEIAQSGDEALELINEIVEDGKELAVIVSDQVMPPVEREPGKMSSGMSGDEFLVKAHQIVPKTKKIMLTGQGQMDKIGNAINNANLYRFLEKLKDETDLKMTVEKAVYSYLLELTVEEQNKNLKLLHKVSQEIARKFELPDLLHDVLINVLDFSNAEKIVLAIRRKDGLYVEAIASAASKNVETMMNHPLSDNNDYPFQLFERVQQSKETIVLHNAAEEGEYNTLPYFKQNNVKSALMLPVMNMGKLTGIYYLENNTYNNLFTSDRVEIIDILAGASAVAIDNVFSMGSKDDLVANRTDELLERLKEMQEISSQKEKIIQHVSHDIRGPLSGIQQLAKLLQDGETATDPNQVKKWGGIIQESIDGILKLANDILDLAKLESGTAILKKSEFELTAYLKSILSAFEPLSMVKGVKVNLNSSGPLTINADQSKLSQAINNLLGNSIKFTPKDKSISLSCEKTDVNGRQMARIEVADQGIGIPAEDLPYVFEKFNKVQRSGTKGEKGTGLGMSIAKEIVELHGGSIAVRSTVGEGTIFTIDLPLT